MTTTANNPISVRLPEDMRKRLALMAKKANRSTSFFIKEAVGNYIELQDWQIEGVKKAIKQMDDGDGIDGDIAMEWFDSLETDNELTMPN
ncbi:MAG: ribbon-helix-helix domain-containing protein [Candidatus Peregrinibacteria bacterium]|nr:ribbon-helix-helix domain-containing protein [Candidatus Peregrinibacteria bacterium]